MIDFANAADGLILQRHGPIFAETAKTSTRKLDFRVGLLPAAVVSNFVRFEKGDTAAYRRAAR